MMCFFQGGLNAMAVGTLICVGPSSLPQLLQHNPPLLRVRLFLNLKSMSHSSRFPLTSAQIPPLHLKYHPPSILFPPLLIVDQRHSLTLFIASGIVQLRFLQIIATALSPRDPLLGTEDTDHEECYSSFLQSSLSRKVQILLRVARHRIPPLNFLPRRFAILQTLVGWGPCLRKLIHFSTREAHSLPAWRTVYHYHQISSMLRARQSHNLRYSRILLVGPNTLRFH